MDHRLLTFDELAERASFGGGRPGAGESPTLLVDLGDGTAPADAVARWSQAALAWPWITVGIGAAHTHDSPLGAAVDVVVDDDERLDLIQRNAAATPIAATSLAVLLRTATGIARLAGIAAESATYSTLQAGPEFARWLAGRDPEDAAARGATAERDVVRVVERDGEVDVVLARPHRHNAVNARLRLELHDALRAAATRVDVSLVLRGDGPSFCSGGDLDEFGTFDDPATAHLIRLTDHPAAAMIALGPERTTARLHGACVGAGIELAAFAGHVTAHPDSWMQLPEVGLGLVPGAGGTVSLPRRIGRQRTALIALTMERVDAPTALKWGLVDEVNP